LSVATRTEAITPSALSRVIVDTTVQPKSVTFPSDAKLLNGRARSWCGWRSSPGLVCANPMRAWQVRPDPVSPLCPRQAVQARQPDAQELKKLRTYLGRVIRDVGRKIEDNGRLRSGLRRAA
jgi:transposase, IS5 family